MTLPLYANAECHALTNNNNSEIFGRSMIRSSVMLSAKYSWSALKLLNGRTTIDELPIRILHRAKAA